MIDPRFIGVVSQVIQSPVHSSYMYSEITPLSKRHQYEATLFDKSVLDLLARLID